MEMIYLDNNATTPLDPEIKSSMIPFLGKMYGNPSSFHSLGRSCRQTLDDARTQVADFLNASPDEIVFTSGGTESINMAIKGCAWKRDSGHIITTAIEHHAVLSCCDHLTGRQGYRVTRILPNSDGFINPDDIRDSIEEDTFLVSIMHANNEIGSIQPLETVGEIIKAANRGRTGKEILFHTDAVQTAAKVDIDVRRYNLDMCSISGHKLYGPKGIGALYIKKGVSLVPLVHGGSHESGRRAGTENVPGIIGLGAACRLAQKRMKVENEKLCRLKNRLYKQIKDKIPDTVIYGVKGECLPNTLNVCFRFMEGEAVVLKLDLAGICVSSGAACSTGRPDPSHVLLSTGLDPVTARSSVRFSFGMFNKEDDIDTLMSVLPDIIKKLREMSPI